MKMSDKKFRKLDKDFKELKLTDIMFLRDPSGSISTRFDAKSFDFGDFITLRDPSGYPYRRQETLTLSKAEILSPLDEVFINDKIKDEVVTHASIPQLLEGATAEYSGVVLHGPAGTGKTVLLRALGDVYKKAGAYAKEVSTAAINTPLVGMLARNLEEEIKIALAHAEGNAKPSFLSFDEGSTLIGNAEHGATSVSRHYQEALDVLKRYVGNDRRLVIGISTNELPEDFDEPLTREGRLTAYHIGYPDTNQRARMWEYFSTKNKIADLTLGEAFDLAEATPEEQGAFIEEFCRSYQGRVRSELLKAKGHKSLVAALKANESVTQDEIEVSMDFDRLYSDLQKALEQKRQRLYGEQEKRRIGFY